MISRSAIGKTAQRVARAQSARGYASAASAGTTSFNYESADVNGIKVASRNIAGPTTKLAVVARAGSRYELLPGLTSGLEQFAFKNTQKRSALRIQRETELLGGQLTSYHTREALVLEAKFLRDDLPYFTELLGEVISETKYTSHEFHEEVEHTLHIQQARQQSTDVAKDAVHQVAFHRGLGNPLLPVEKQPLYNYLSEESISEFSKIAYAKPNIAVVANGADQASLSKWVGQFFSSTSSTYPHADVVKSKFDAATKYYGGETRIASTASKQAYVIAFPGSSSFTAGSSYKPELAVLATLLGGQSTIKWSPGFSLLGQVATSSNASINTTHSAYSDAGLLSINLAGSSASIRKALPEVVKVLKSISEGSVPKEAFTKAVANAKFNAIEEGMNLDAGLVATGSGLILGGKAFQIDEVTKAIESVSQEKLQAAAKGLLEGKASVAAVGDLHALPFAEEIGLRV